MKFEEKSFSSRPSSDAYRDNWEATFGKKPAIQVLTGKLCTFCLTELLMERGHALGRVPTQRCVLPEGHEGNHQLEAV